MPFNGISAGTPGPDVREAGASASAGDASMVTNETKPSRGLGEELSQLFLSGREAVSHFLDLLTLEARRAYQSLMWMVVLSIVAAICFISAWLGLLATLVIWVIASGATAFTAVLSVAMINGIAAFMLIYLCIRKGRHLLFSGTRRRLAGVEPLKSEHP